MYMYTYLYKKGQCVVLVIYVYCMFLCLKVLQSIGNLRNEVEAKELFLSPMLSVLQGGVVEVRKFVDKIISVEEASTTLNSSRACKRKKI